LSSDTEIGRVVTVDTSQVTVELLAELKALARSTYEGQQEVGQINSYVIIPVGARRLVAMVTRVLMTEESEVTSDRTMVSLPSARRLMKATLIGTIEAGVFTQGVSVFPVLHSPVHLVGKDDLRTIFDVREANIPVDADDPGFIVDIGESLIFPGFSISADPDAMFGKHLAVLGSTGSGKSCSIAAILQAVLALPGILKTTIVVLDTNGEYAAAFPAKGGEDEVQECLCISSAAEGEGRLTIPYWFMNADDFLRLYRAGEGVQGPVLLRALRLARAAAGQGQRADTVVVLEVMRTTLRRANDMLLTTGAAAVYTFKNIVELCEGGLVFREEFAGEAALLDETYGPDAFSRWEACLNEVLAIARANLGKVVTSVLELKVRQATEPVVSMLDGLASRLGKEVSTVSADQPSYFSETRFLEHDIPVAMGEQGQSGNAARVRENCGTMLLRIRRFEEDKRFRFLFSAFPDAPNVLAAFIRDILGLPSVPANLADENQVPPGALPFYDRQRAATLGSNVVIVDLSLLSSEVLENVTALLGRLVLEFQQRLREQDPTTTGSLPVVLVLEEAQNYIPERRPANESISRTVFERIAREGRKFGLGLVVASQRPSELSRTVLSQCSSFIVHRLQNPEDLRYFREVVPGVYGALLEQLPSLAARCALVFGEFVRAPALVRIREACPTPMSRDPKFYRSWVEGADADVERICTTWENRPNASGEDLPLVGSGGGGPAQ